MTLFDPVGLVPTRPEPAPPRPRRSTGSRVAAIVGAVLIAAGVAFWAPWDPARGHEIIDTVRIWVTPSPAEIVALADASGMSETGRRIFLASSPELDEAEAFNANCTVEEQIVLGCYGGGQIYLYRVTDERLSGTNEATAAHEMLHAAYERLSPADRERIDGLLAALLASLPEDHALHEELAAYSPDEQADELHSRAGIEVDDLAPELEEYYARYFVDRTVVQELYHRSNAALDETLGRIDELTAELDRLGADIEKRREAWDAASSELDDEIEAYNASGWTPDSDRTYLELVERSDARERERLALVADIDHYNELVAELDELNATGTELYEQLDSMSGAREPAP